MNDRVRQQWNEWLQHGEEQFTRTRKRRRAAYDTVAMWVVDAWNDMPCEMIQQSFTHCGIASHVGHITVTEVVCARRMSHH